MLLKETFISFANIANLASNLISQRTVISVLHKLVEYIDYVYNIERTVISVLHKVVEYIDYVYNIERTVISVLDNILYYNSARGSQLRLTLAKTIRLWDVA